MKEKENHLGVSRRDLLGGTAKTAVVAGEILGGEVVEHAVGGEELVVLDLLCGGGDAETGRLQTIIGLMMNKTDERYSGCGEIRHGRIAG